VVLSDVGVLDIVTEEAESVEKFILSQLGRLMELVSEKCLGIVLNDFESSVFENFNKLTCKFHHLASDI